MLSVLIYLTPLWITVLGAFGRPAKRQQYIFFACISIFLILALRQNVGYDYGEYLFRLSENIPPREPIAQLLFYFSRWTSIYPLYFVFNALISIFLLYRVAKREDNIWIIINYITLPWFFVESFSAVRQALSIVFAINAYHHYSKKEHFWFFTFGILSACAHYAAIPFILILSILNLSDKYSRYIFLFVFSIFLWSFFNDAILSLFIQNIGVLRYYSNGTSFGFGQLVLAIIMIVISTGAIGSRNSSKILWIGLIIFIICLSIDSALSRLAWFFFIPLLWFDWRLVFGRIRLTGAIRLFPILFLSALLLTYLWVKSADELNSLIPYTSYLSGMFG